MNHVVDASSSSWLQEHMTDMSERLVNIIHSVKLISRKNFKSLKIVKELMSLPFPLM